MQKNDTFINVAAIEKLLADTAKPDRRRAFDVLDRALEKKGLSPEDAAVLLNNDDPEVTERLFEEAGRVKYEIYGRRLVLFAPLYIANYCANNCLYCAFRRDNRSVRRHVLSMSEIAEETLRLEQQGHKRLLLLTGEDMVRSGLDYFLEAVHTVYATKTPDGKGAIRRINVEIAPLDEAGFRQLKAADIGTYVLFQETYHPETYARMHPSGPKADYSWRLYAMHRAQAGGIDDVGLGVLLGLHADYRFEALGMLEHARCLERDCGVGPHTLSVPRLEPALNAPAAQQPPHPISDHDFKRLVAILRLAVPYTGIILSTRERPELRNELFALGISQISAGSRTNPGGYGTKGDDQATAQQFALGDTRSLEEVIQAVCAAGYLPSFCTGCYRKGRTGQDFMELAKPGLINRFCLPNAILTFAEYLMDYAGPETQAAGRRVIQAQLDEISDASRRSETIQRLNEMQGGQRDLYF